MSYDILLREKSLTWEAKKGKSQRSTRSSPRLDWNSKKEHLLPPSSFIPAHPRTFYVPVPVPVIMPKWAWSSQWVRKISPYRPCNEISVFLSLEYFILYNDLQSHVLSTNYMITFFITNKYKILLWTYSSVSNLCPFFIFLHIFMYMNIHLNP